MNICPQCGEELEVGDWPFCGSPGGHGSVYSRDALAFEPAVVWQSISDSERYSFPGSSTEPCPAGYRPIALDSIRKADRFTREFNAQERERLSGERAIEKAYWDERIKQARADRRAQLGHNPQALALMEAVARYRDAKRERKYGRKIEPNFHLQALEFDAGNRQGYSSKETNWRDRKA